MSTAPGPAIAVRGLSRHFGEQVAVTGVDLTVMAGEVFGVLGPNGAGKTTTLRLLCGLLAPTAGGGTVLGHDLATGAAAIKRDLGYMSQGRSLYPDLSVSENLRFFAGLHGLPFTGSSPHLQRQLERYGLWERRGQVVGTLSGGWRQRAALACATVHAPRLLLLDEPTAGVDPVSRREFWRLIGAVARTGTTVLVTTHSMDEAERFDRLAFIFRGRLLQVGTPGDLVAANGLQAVTVTCDDAPHQAHAWATDPLVVEAAAHGRQVRVVARATWPAPAGARTGPVTIEDTFIVLAQGHLAEAR